MEEEEEGRGGRQTLPALLVPLVALVPDATVVILGDGTNHVLPLRRLSGVLCVVAGK